MSVDTMLRDRPWPLCPSVESEIYLPSIMAIFLPPATFSA